MITELMIILIVVGAVIIFAAWTSARKRKQDDEERKDAEESAEKFKQDLEKTANEIIGRMESQAARLEKLLNESERSRTQLEGRTAELKKLLKKFDSVSTETRDLLTRIDFAVENVDALQRQLDSVEQKINSPQPAKVSNVRPLQQTPPLPPPKDNFAQILEKSMTENSTPRRSEQLSRTPPPRKISELPAKNISPALEDSTEFTGDSAAIREMLLAGMTVEEISRETGLGRGAILLIQQMLRRKI